MSAFATGLYVSQKKPELHRVEVMAKINVRSFERGADGKAHEVRGRLTLMLCTARELPLGVIKLKYLWQAEVTLWLPWGSADDLRIDQITELNSLEFDKDDIRDLIYTSEICDVLMAEIERTDG